MKASFDSSRAFRPGELVPEREILVAGIEIQAGGQARPTPARPVEHDPFATRRRLQSIALRPHPPAPGHRLGGRGLQTDQDFSRRVDGNRPGDQVEPQFQGIALADQFLAGDAGGNDPAAVVLAENRDAPLLGPQPDIRHVRTEDRVPRGLAAVPNAALARRRGPSEVESQAVGAGVHERHELVAQRQHQHQLLDRLGRRFDPEHPLHHSVVVPLGLGSAVVRPQLPRRFRHDLRAHSFRRGRSSALHEARSSPGSEFQPHRPAQDRLAAAFHLVPKPDRAERVLSQNGRKRLPLDVNRRERLDQHVRFSQPVMLPRKDVPYEGMDDRRDRRPFERQHHFVLPFAQRWHVPENPRLVFGQWRHGYLGDGLGDSLAPQGEAATADLFLPFQVAQVRLEVDFVKRRIVGKQRLDLSELAGSGVQTTAGRTGRQRKSRR